MSVEGVVRVAIVQLCSSDDLPANLEAVRSGVAQAAATGASFIALPENFAYLRREGMPYPCAQDVKGEIVSQLCALAREHSIWVLGGSFPEAIPNDRRVYNTSVLISAEGACVARYRKMHLFDVDLGDRGGAFQESKMIAPGRDIVVAQTPFGPVGMSVCYDLRFPELYRGMLERGVRWLTVPAAFAPETGKDHWEVLLRARAIENQVFVVAPAQTGRHTADRSSYGRSMIVDPWGVVLAQAGDRPGVIVADCDLAQQDSIRASIPCLDNRRL